MLKSRDKIFTRIEEACSRGDRHVSDVQLVAVSKKQSVEKIRHMFDLGQKIFAENYVQEFLEKKQQLNIPAICWHLIGPLQTNKVGKIIGEFDLIHSVDSLKLAKILSEKSAEKNIVQKILLQINIANETSKSGINTKDHKILIEEVLKLPNIKLLGLMTMPPFSQNPEDSRIHFENLRKIRDDFKGSGLTELSMGTTQDFEIAIEEGATIIRIGEALFGPR